MLDNHLEAVFRQSTANEWTITCPQCSHAAILDERALGPHGLICSDCQGTIDARQGQWVPRNPDAKWGDGFWINHAMVPWLNYDDLLERQRTYDLARFKNEVLGLPTTLGDHIVTREELEACCDSQPMTQSLAQIPPAARSQLVAGIDWGGGGASRTVLVIGYMDPKFCFHVSRFERFAPSAIKEDPIQVSNAVAERCRQFQVRWIAADGGGNGHVFNRLLLDKLKRHEGLHAILYGVVDQEPFRDGVLIKWTVNRSASIGVLFSRIKNHQMAFPRTPDCGGYLDEFACEIAEYDSINRTIKFSHPESQPDDALHATNYALLVAIKAFHAARSW